jgi:glutamate N-acetyltransferase / amino-acid N-acetyltransferase
MMIWKKIPGSICAPRGFRCAAVFCDIKKIGTGKGSEKGQKRDLALIVSDIPAAVAGMFTSNQVRAAPVKLSAKHAARKDARAIVVNSGNANACTGRQGMTDAQQMARATAASATALYKRLKNSARLATMDRGYRIKESDILVCSTGRIGVPMPMKNIDRGIRDCAALLSRSIKNARQVAEAIMTTDTRRKEIAIEFVIDKVKVRLGGICKGAGMIQPGMDVATGPRPVRTAHGVVATTHATMLAFITTDAAIEAQLLKRALADAVGQSFNRITVDGDMSTNDSVIMLASGLAENSKLKTKGSKEFKIFQAALNHVCLELAKMIVRDGEGVSRFVTLYVRGARDKREAESAARAIASSSLVRTSWCGGDPNWGRVLCALGYSTAKVDESIVDVGYSGPADRDIVWGFRRGTPTNISLRKLAKITARSEFNLYVDLHLGRHDFVLYASDLTENYVSLNKGDVSDPTSLGG